MFVYRSSSGPIVIGAGKPIPFGGINASIQPKLNKLESQSTNSNSTVSKFVLKGIGDVGPLGIRRPDINPITSVDEFCPDGGNLDKNFLEDLQDSPQSPNAALESDSEEDTGNPLVSAFQDDCEIDSDVAVFPSGKANYELDSTIASETSGLTSEPFDTWMASDTKWRQPPEGGEDNSIVRCTSDYNTSTQSSKMKVPLLSSKRSGTSANASLNDSDNEEHSVNSALVTCHANDKNKPQ